MRRELFVCHCGDVSHQFVVSSFDDEEEIYIEMHLSDVGFWNRLKYAFWYVLGKRSRYGCGAFGEVFLNKEQITHLIDVLHECSNSTSNLDT